MKPDSILRLPAASSLSPAADASTERAPGVRASDRQRRSSASAIQLPWNP